MKIYEICIFIVFSIVEISEETLQDDIMRELNNTSSSSRSLIRKRRYIVFPEGSSFQLVYCLTMPSIGVGQIFTVGGTAALAWQLPTDVEEVFEIFGKRRITTSTTTTTEHPTLPYLEYDNHHPYGDYVDRGDPNINNRIDYTPQNSRSSAMYNFGTSHHNPFSQYKNSFFGYSPANNKPSYQPGSYRQYTEYSGNSNVESIENIHPVYHRIHRRTRRSLYSKLENLFTALSKDGKACLLKAICEVSQVEEGKGTFMEEIIKAIFRIKPHENYPSEDIYDEAANKSHDCKERYSSCKNSVWEDMF